MVIHKYTEEERAFLREYTPGHSYKEILNAYNERFPEPITMNKLKACINRYKLNTGRSGYFEKGHTPFNKGRKGVCAAGCETSWFKNGHLPHNTKPIGYERINKNGYIEVKVKMRPSRPGRGDNFIAKQRLVWEEHYGRVPDGHKVIFLDGDNRNFDIGNLALISNNENLQLTRLGVRSESPELMKSAIALVRTSIATEKRRKRKE